MKVGILGGTFDPIHFGHLMIAEQARDQLGLDRLIFMPAAIPPHKRNANISDGQTRMHMLKLAGCNSGPFETSDLELRRPGVSFTVDTLRHFRTTESEADLYLIVGRDNLVDLPNWREPGTIADLTTIAYADRVEAATTRRDEPVKTMPEGLAAFRVVRIDVPLIEISGRDIRRRVREGRSIRYFVPAEVEKFIHERRLYFPTTATS